MNGISVIVTFYNGISSLKLCLSLLKESLKEEKNHEIIVVNDNPTINVDFIVQQYDVKLLNLSQNMGYAGACNYGAQKASNDTLLFMDCDIYPIDNWLEKMKETYRDINEKGCVSATIYEADTGNLFGYGISIYEVDILLFLRHGKPTAFISEDRDVPIVSSGCMMVNRDLYRSIGGQDELCRNIHCDVDFSFRILKKGFCNRMSSKAKVFHRGEISGPIRTIPFKQDVKAYLFKKWGDELSTLCNTEEYLRNIWSFFNASNIISKNVIFVNVSNSLYCQNYIDMLANYFKLNILQTYDIKNIQGQKEIILQEVVSWDLCRLNIPVVYFTDDYRNLHNNYYWFLNRGQNIDLICDKNGNLMYSSDFHTENFNN